MDSLVKKLRGIELKSRLSTWLTVKEERCTRGGFYVVIKEFMEKQIKRARVLRKTIKSGSNKEEKVKYTHCYKTGHIEKNCFNKYSKKSL